MWFLNYPFNKKYPKNKSSPNAPKLKYDFFWNIWEYLALKTQQGEQALGHEGPGRAHPYRARPLPRGPMVAPLHLLLHPHSSSSSQKNHYPAQARVLAHFAAIFDLLAQSSIHKTASGDCSLVCDSSNGPISFCSSALFIAFFAAEVTLFLSLHVKFIWSKVVLMHDIGPRHL